MTNRERLNRTHRIDSEFVGKTASDPDVLRALTEEACRDLYEKRFSEPWRPGAEDSVSRYLLSLWYAALDDKAEEDEARALFERVRRARAGGRELGPAVTAEIHAFVQKSQGGGAATAALLTVADDLGRGSLPLELEPPSWFEDTYGEHLRPCRREGFTALIQVLADNSGRSWLREHAPVHGPPVAIEIEGQWVPAQLPDRLVDDGMLSNRDIAVFAILADAVDGWKGYSNHALTPARVIEDVESRVRAIRGTVCISSFRSEI